MPVIETDDAQQQPPDPATLSHDSQKNGLIACAVVCIVIAAVFVGLRFYTRTTIRRVLAWSDWILLVALGTSVTLSVFSIEQAIHGVGSHVWDINLEIEYYPVQRAAWFSIFFYTVTLYLIKGSILLLYLHIFTYTRVRFVIYLVTGFTALSALYNIAVTTTTCVPLDAFWDLTKAEGAYCHKTEVFWVNTALHVVTDYMIFAVPLPEIWSMKLPRRQKAVLVGLFSAGFLVCFISIARVILLADLHKKQDPDFSYAGAPLLYASMIEVNAAIVVACFITFKPLANKYFPTWLNGPVDPGAELTGEKPATIGTQPIRTSPARTNPGAPDLEAARRPSLPGGLAEWERLASADDSADRSTAKRGEQAVIQPSFR